MRQFIIFILSLATVSGMAATSDVVSGEVLPNGWMLKLTLTNSATNGTYNLGLGATILTNGYSNVYGGAITNNNLTLLFTDMGFDDSLAATTVRSLVVGTRPCRIPYQGAAADGSGGTSANGSTLHTTRFLEASNANGTITITLALNDYVWARSSNVTANIKSGFYIRGNATNNAVNGLVITNNSLVQYKSILASWANVPFQLRQGSTYTNRLVAFQYSARNYRPVRAVKFWGVCGSRTNQPVTVLSPTVTMTDQTPVVEYVGVMDMTPFNQLDLVTNHVAIASWVGDTNSFIDTLASGQQPEYQTTNDWGLVGTSVIIADPNSNLPVTYARVDQVNGTQSALSFTNSVINPSTSGTSAFLTIGMAYTNALATNQLKFGANSNLVPITILLTNGNYMGLGSNNISLAGPAFGAWVTIANDPNVTRDSVVITNKGSGQFNSGARDFRLRVKNVTIGDISAAIWNDGLRSFWLDSCVVRSNGNANNFIVTSVTNTYATSCVLGRYRPGFGFKVSNGVQLDKWKLLRNLLFTNQFEGRPAVVLGCLQATQGIAAQNAVNNDLSGSGPTNALTTMNPYIIAYNRFYSNDCSVLSIGWGLNCSNVVNTAFVQNLLESVIGTYPALDVMNSQIPFEAETNCLVWNNTVLCVYHPPFNHVTNQQEYIEAYSDKNNIFATREASFDTGAGGAGSQQNGVRTNRWSLMYSVGCSGNVSGRLVGQPLHFESTGTSGNYGFAGLNSLYIGDNPNVLQSSNSVYYAFIKNGSSTNGNASVGAGDYRLSSASPLIQTAKYSEQLIPFDIDGNDRTLGINVSGVYVYFESKLQSAIIRNAKIGQ